MIQSARLTHWKYWIKITTIVWTHVYTDRSSEMADAGSTSTLVMAKHFHSCWMQHAVKQITRQCLLLCMKLPAFSAWSPQPCPALSSLQTASLLSKTNTHTESSWKETQHFLCDLSQHSKVAVQWSPAHLQDTRRQIISSSLAVKRAAQPGISYGEAKALIQQLSSHMWMQTHSPQSDDQKHQLSHYQQTTIIRLCTGHCHLCSHVYCLGLLHTLDCQREPASQILEHILQSCPLLKEARIQFVPGKLYCRSHQNPGDSLQKQFTSSSPQTSMFEDFSPWTTEEERLRNFPESEHTK